MSSRRRSIPVAARTTEAVISIPPSTMMSTRLRGSFKWLPSAPRMTITSAPNFSAWRPAPACELGAADAVRKAEEVLDHRGVRRLPVRNMAFEDDRRETVRGRRPTTLTGGRTGLTRRYCR
jgi:hypothetical protein